MKFKAAFRKLKNYKEINILRKNTARIWTILTERALEELMAKSDKEKVKAQNVK